jgi:hypothetical protein
VLGWLAAGAGAAAAAGVGVAAVGLSSSLSAGAALAGVGFLSAMVVQDSRPRLESRRGGGGKEKVERTEMLAKMVGRRDDGCCVLWFVGEESME